MAAPLLVCVGDLDVDLVLRVAGPPGRDGKVDGRRVAQGGGGMAANVAVGARRLGTPTRLVAAAGDDAMGREALDALDAAGVDRAFVAVHPGEATFFCVVLVSDDGEKSLVKVLSPTYLPRPEELAPAALAGAAHVHLTFARQDLAERAVALARAAGATVSLDLEAADLLAVGAFAAELATAVDLLFVSEESRRALEVMTGPLRAERGRAVITTRGAQGVTYEGAGERHAVSGHAVVAVDTTGAGDAFAAAFLHARLGGQAPGPALAFANAAAALSIRAYGAQTGLATADEVAAFLTSREQNNA